MPPKRLQVCLLRSCAKLYEVIEAANRAYSEAQPGLELHHHPNYIPHPHPRLLGAELTVWNALDALGPKLLAAQGGDADTTLSYDSFYGLLGSVAELRYPDGMSMHMHKSAAPRHRKRRFHRYH